MSTSHATFDEFWLYYLGQHARPQTRATHLAGTITGLALVLAAAVWATPWLILVGGVVGYALAWIGHAVFEGNRPATFVRPLWSLAADLRMLRLWLMGRLEAELARAGVAPGK